MTVTWSRACGLALGFVADSVLGDPQRWHPVAGLGQGIAWLEGRMYAPDRSRGVLFAGFIVGAAGALGLLAERATRRRPLLNTAVVAAATWAAVGGTSLGQEATMVAGLLESDDLPAARQRVTHLVGRDPAQLSADEVARATVESVAENTSDAVVAPLLAGAMCGVPGLLGYRAANTLDAMIGHRSDRYEEFGWASARLDDLLNLAPARLSGILAAGLAPVVGGRPRNAVRSWRTGARKHPSPNAGVVEASFAGALNVTLGGRNVYGDRVEDRVQLGHGCSPGVADIPRSVRLARAVNVAALGVTAGIAVFVSRRRAGG